MRITIVPTIPEYGMYREDYEALVDALRGLGHDARVEHPTGGLERRDVPDVVHTGIDVAIYLAERVGEGALGAIGVLLLQRLGRKTKRRRREAVIHGPSGEVLRRVELPPSED